MNIDSQLRNLFTSYPSHAPQADMQHSAPNVPRAQQGPQINYAGNDAKSPASNAAFTGHTTKSETNSISSFLDRLMKMFDGSAQRKTQPDAQASNAASSGSNTNANNHGNPANRANGSGGSNTQQGEQSYSGKSGDEPKKSGPYSEQDLVSGFRQEGGTENCVTVGAIKAAMQKEGGPAEVYDSVEKKGDGFDVKMKDSDKIYHVSNTELEEAAKKSGFKGDNQQMLKDANFMYAVSAKREQQESGGSFSDGLNALNQVQLATKGFERLGLKDDVRQASAQELANGEAGVIAQNNHVAAVLDGNVEDYGTLGRTPDAGVYALKLV